MKNFIFIILFVSTIIFNCYSIDIDFFDKYVGEYNFLEAEKNEWKLYSEFKGFDKKTLNSLSKDGKIIYYNIKTYGYSPGKLIIKKKEGDGRGIRYRFSYDGSFLINLGESNIDVYDEEKCLISTKENIIKDEIIFHSDDLIEIKVCVLNDLFPDGTSFSIRILYQRI